MNIKKKTQPLILLAFIFVCILVSCKDHSSDKIPLINKVVVTDPALIDSSFVKAERGQMIVIVGENLETTKEIYINNQSISFNTNYVTSTSIIITIPSELELTATNPDLPNEIRIVTDYGTAIYEFHVTASAPYITFMSVERYPVVEGDKITIIGENFFEIEKIVMEGENGIDTEIIDYDWIVVPTEENGTSEISFVLPANVCETGQIVLYCAAGEAVYEYALVVLPPTIKSVSTDMPVLNDEFFVTGSNFIMVENVNINGSIDIDGEDLTVSKTLDTIYLKLPKIPESSGYITVKAAGGEATSSKLFYPKEYVIADFDEIGGKHWYGNIFTADGVREPLLTTGNVIGGTQENVGSYNWWMGDGNVDFIVNLTNSIDDNTPLSELVMRFECYITYPLNGVTFKVALPNQDCNFTENYIPVSISSGITEIGKWMTCEVNLDSKEYDNGTKIETYGDLRNIHSQGGDDKCSPGFFPVNTTDIEVGTFEAWFDNIRIMKKDNE